MMSLNSPACVSDLTKFQERLGLSYLDLMPASIYSCLPEKMCEYAFRELCQERSLGVSKNLTRRAQPISAVAGDRSF